MRQLFVTFQHKDGIDEMKELGEALKIILTKVGDFFDIFDLSFFVAGSVTFLGGTYAAQRLGIQVQLLTGAWPQILLGLILIYVSGLLSFILGRWLRHGFNYLRRKSEPDNDFEQRFLPILRAHGLEQDPRFSGYLERRADRGHWRIYTRMWAELRYREQRTASMALLRRYWVMAATCDGLCAALLVWSGIALWVGAPGLLGSGQWNIALTTCVALFALATLVLREANRYETYQQEELVASLATEVTTRQEQTADQ